MQFFLTYERWRGYGEGRKDEGRAELPDGYARGELRQREVPDTLRIGPGRIEVEAPPALVPARAADDSLQRAEAASSRDLEPHAHKESARA